MCADRDIRPKRGQRGRVGEGGKNAPPRSGPTPRPCLRKHLKFQTGQRLMAVALRAPLSACHRQVGLLALNMRQRPIKTVFPTLEMSVSASGHGSEPTHVTRELWKSLDTGFSVLPKDTSRQETKSKQCRGALSFPGSREEGCRLRPAGAVLGEWLPQARAPRKQQGKTPLKGCTAGQAHKTGQGRAGCVRLQE